MTYKRPSSNVVISTLEVEKSRFITRVSRAESVESAREFIHVVRTLEPNATHHVYAYCIGFGNTSICGMSDAGEPPGTAGRPTLTVLQGAQLGDVVLVTSRYFGGRKLGTGGLVRAYTEAAQQALALCTTELKVSYATFTMLASYKHYNRLCQVLTQHDAVIRATEFTDQVWITFDIQPNHWQACKNALQDASAGELVLVSC